MSDNNPTPAAFAMLEVIRTLKLSDLTQLLRQTVSYAYLGDCTAVCKILGESALFVDTRDLHLAPHLMLDGFWEIWITQAMARCLKPGMTAVDVGANFGYYTLLMASAVGTNGQVYAFEPNPRMMELLAKSLPVNGMHERVQIDTRAAYSSSGETLRFFIPDVNPMNSALLDIWGLRAAESHGKIIDTETVKLDDALPDRVDFIKIDVEGAEQRVWAGLQKTITNNPDVQIFLEFNAARYHDTAAQFLDKLLAPGFALRAIADDGKIKARDREEVLSTRDDIILYLCRH